MELQKWSETLVCFFCCYVLVQGLSIDTTTVSSNDASIKATEKNVAKNEDTKHAMDPPLIFPSEQFKVLQLNDTFSNNDTAIKILLSKARQENFASTDGQTISREANQVETTIMTTPKPAHIEPTDQIAEDVDEGYKNDVEEVQKSEEKSEEENAGLEELYHKQQSSNLVVTQVFAEDIETHGNNLHGGHITAIFGGVLAAVAIAIYVGLISWRSYLEKRYGMREQLVTEDDYYNNNDIRHFSL